MIYEGEEVVREMMKEEKGVIHGWRKGEEQEEERNHGKFDILEEER